MDCRDRIEWVEKRLLGVIDKLKDRVDKLEHILYSRHKTSALYAHIDKCDKAVKDAGYPLGLLTHLLDLKLEDTTINIRTINALGRSGIDNLHDLVIKAEWEIYICKNFGKGCFNNLTKIMNDLSISLFSEGL